MATWQNTQNKNFIKTCLERMRGPVLVWVEQFLDLLEPHLQKKVTLNDIGCNMGQFWKGLTERKITLEYHGFDIEPLYLAKAKKLFPKIKSNFHHLDIEYQSPPLADITVVSATLEHLQKLSPGLDNILSSTKKVVLLRTFLGERSEKHLMFKRDSKNPYPINQYSFYDVLKLFAKYNFKTRVIRDHYTDSMPKYIAIETKHGQGMVRTQYIILGQKI